MMEDMARSGVEVEALLNYARGGRKVAAGALEHSSAPPGSRRGRRIVRQTETTMTDTKATPEDPHLETDEIQADRARQQGLGVGERELQAQRDPGGVQPADEDERLADENDDVERIDDSIGVQGQAS
jgi:hypothetical protein